MLNFIKYLFGFFEMENIFLLWQIEEDQSINELPIVKWHFYDGIELSLVYSIV
jgi:hypothetical protein